jgi:hypothetical protein
LIRILFFSPTIWFKPVLGTRHDARCTMQGTWYMICKYQYKHKHSTWIRKMFHGYRTLLNQLFMVGYNRYKDGHAF